MTMSTKNNSVSIAAVPIMKPTSNSLHLPAKTICAPTITKVMTRNIDQMAAKEALFIPPRAFELDAATAIETAIWIAAKN
jgi:hypothetical protein